MILRRRILPYSYFFVRAENSDSRIILCPISGNLIEELSGEELLYAMFMSVDFSGTGF
jgi:hypothetical protein